jgi:hypothetical protein
MLCLRAIRKIILPSLDAQLLLMHGRLAILKMDHPETRQRLESHLRAIEEMLDLARVKAANL